MDTEVLFESKQQVAPDVWEFCLRLPHSFEYLPGQYIHALLPSNQDSRGEYRTMSLTSHPSESQLRFITRIENQRSDYKSHLLNLKSGDVLWISQAMGDAILPRQVTTPLIFAAQGIAIASYIAILNECERSDLSHSITLFWTRRSEDNSLEMLIPGKNKHVTRYDYIYPTRLTAKDILKTITPETLVYLSGSQKFVETLGSELEKRSIARSRIIYDYYEGYADL